MAARSGRRRSSPPSASTTGRAPSRSSCPRRRSSTAARRSQRGAAQQTRVDRAVRCTIARTSRSSPPSSSASPTIGARENWDADVPDVRSPTPRGSRRASRLRRCCSGRPGRCPSWSAAPPTWPESTLTLIDEADNVDTRRLRRPQPPLRHPRARDGRDRQRPHAARLPCLRRDVPDLQRLHAAARSGSRR